MKVFQIQKNEVLIVDNNKKYADTVENFKLDSNLKDELSKTIFYDDNQECCVIDGNFLNYPNSNFDTYINNIDVYISAKEKREYIPEPPKTEEEIQKEKEAELEQEYNTQLESFKNDMLIALLNNNSDAIKSIQEEIIEFNAAYVEAKEEIKVDA